MLVTYTIVLDEAINLLNYRPKVATAYPWMKQSVTPIVIIIIIISSSTAPVGPGLL
jgi:hypothetical protein